MTQPIQTQPTFLPPFRFEALIKNAIWGGSFMKYFKHLPHFSTSSVGESWEISALEGNETRVAEGPDAGLTLTELVDKYGAELVGQRCIKLYGHRFPILVKFIDAARDLSVQVHPDDAMAAELGLPSGKNEMWHILRASGHAKIYAGFLHDFSPEEYDACLADDTIVNHIIKHTSHAGDTFYLPAGTIHSIGAGNFLIEVQQTSGVTYRVYDFNRTDANGKKRQLHVDEARRALCYDAYAPEKFKTVNSKPENRTLMRTEWSKVKRHDITKPAKLSFREDSFTILSGIEGELTISYPGQTFSLGMGQTVLLAAGVCNLAVEGKGAMVSVTL